MIVPCLRYLLSYLPNMPPTCCCVPLGGVCRAPTRYSATPLRVNVDDIVVLVTYAGQLHKVREELGAAKLRVLLSEQDRAELERAGESEGEDEGEGR